MMTAQMATKLDAARAQIWKAAWLADGKQPEARVLGLLAKVNASETAFEACKLAGEALGGASIMHDHPAEISARCRELPALRRYQRALPAACGASVVQQQRRELVRLLNERRGTGPFRQTIGAFPFPRAPRCRQWRSCGPETNR